MTTYYVDSGASGANNGTSKTDAWTSIASAYSVAAGSIVLVSHTHDESSAVAMTIDFANGTIDNPILILSVNFATDALTFGAYLWTTPVTADLDMTIADTASRYSGFTFGRGDQLRLGDTSRHHVKFYDCTFEQHRTSSGAFGGLDVYGNQDSAPNSLWEFEDCTFTHVQTGGQPTFIGFGGNRAGDLSFRGCSISVSHTSGGNLINGPSVNAQSGLVTFEGCDLTGFSTLLNGVSNPLNQIKAVIRNCELRSGVTYSSGTIEDAAVNGHELLVEGCSNGTISGPELGLTRLQNKLGVVAADSTRYRTGGASDGTNNYSWSMATTAGALELFRPLASIPVLIWTSAGSFTLTIYVAFDSTETGGTVNDDDFWIEVLSPSEAGSPTAQHKWQTTRAGLLSTPTALATDSGSTWNGSNVGVARKVSVSISPAVAGPVIVRCFLAKPSISHCYVDPVIEVA